MLILTRKIGESILVGDNIRVVVLEVRGRQIRLGIEAPMDIVVLREEIAQRLADENLQAANSQFQDVQQALQSLETKVARRDSLRPSQPGSPTVTIDSKALGQVTVPEDRIITFAAGLPGFPDFQRYALLNGHVAPPFSYLQCVNNPSLGFVVTDPSVLVPDYQSKNGGGALKDLGAQSYEDLQVLVTLTIPPGRPREMTANLMSPLLINPELRLGKQVVLEKSPYSHQYPVLSLAPGSQSQGTGNGNSLNGNK